MIRTATSPPAVQAKVLEALGLRLPGDLLLHLPLRYQDLTHFTAIEDLIDGHEAQVRGRVVAAKIIPKPRKTLMVTIEDASGRMEFRFFSFYPSQVKMMSPDTQVRAYGLVRANLGGVEMIHPTVQRDTDAEIPDRLTPVYPTVAGLTQTAIRKAVDAALQNEVIADTVPAAWLARLGLPGLGYTLSYLHHPPPNADLLALQQRTDPAWQRVIFDELLAQQISLRQARAARLSLAAPVLPENQLTQRFIDALPFQLTGAQGRAWQEISQELARSVPMNRLLQGDVGSGKTVVAALAACQAIGNQYQAAFMAPTEILAEQHYLKLLTWLQPLGVRVGWLAGSLKEREKREVRAACEQGDIDLLIGTHALIQDSVAFKNLGLAIVDEQHRFGVAQRIALRNKLKSEPGVDGLRTADGHSTAHQLMMSATPIPRTLSMSYLADLDVSLIDELPPGRSPITTKLISEARRAELIERVADAIADGQQVYWICPLIEESETLQLQTATDTFEQLRRELANARVGLVHGRLSAADKAEVMRAFAAAELDLLVSTTVIEVGVDVPNASLMVIEHAERFGLAQLHQLRGRVGRGARKSTCVLLYRNPLSENGKERLKVIYENQDGFEIARRDLQLRGPGEYLGARQSGQPLLRFADLERDIRLLESARELAVSLLAEREDLAQAHVQRWYGRREEFLKA